VNLEGASGREPLHIDVLSLFPSYIEGPLRESILKRAIERDLLRVSSVDIRDFSPRKDRRVDDRPFGGGPGMVLMAEPVVAAIRSRRGPSSRVVYVSPQGEPLTPQLAKELALLPHLILVCGHYEGVDQRALESDVDQEISIGDYVLTNGCLAALVIIDAVARFVPGVLGHEEAATTDSFEHGIFDHPHYTHPRTFEERSVPEPLLTGDHKEADLWRHDQALMKTLQVRPELVARRYLPESSLSVRCAEIERLVEPSFRFEESARFYGRLFGCSPQMNEELGTCMFEGVPLTLFRVGEPLSPLSSMLVFNMSEDQFRKAVGWCSKAQGRIIERGDGWALVKDPDGRLLRMKKNG
jgi:tRNA (guanine37-N1)-methyltransferase